MINKILVPVDFSESSLNAMETALEIAIRHKALLQILHVSDVTAIDGNGGNAKELENEREIFDAMAGSIMQKHGVKSEILFMEGFVGPTIVKTAFLNKPDLVVMGAHGASGYRELFIGSNTNYVVKFYTCPVLIIPEGKKWHYFQRVVFPARTPFGALQRYDIVRHLIKEQTPVTLQLNQEKNIARDVLEHADRSNADLIVVTPAIDVVNKPNFVGPFSQRILNHAKVPVLYIHK